MKKIDPFEADEAFMQFITQVRDILERGLKEEVEMKMSSDEVMVEEVAEVEGGGGGDEVGGCGTHPGYWSEESERLMSLRH